MTYRTPLRAMLYAAAIAFAIPGGAMADKAAWDELRTGEMKKLLFLDAPTAAGDAAITTRDGTETSLAAWKGKTVLLNFWAVWCAPCKKEMPMLDALQGEMGSDAFEVVVVATGRNDPNGIDRFWDEQSIANIETYLDPKSTLARQMAILGLPITVILDPGWMVGSPDLSKQRRRRSRDRSLGRGCRRAMPHPPL